jgi:hypothetical protein
MVEPIAAPAGNSADEVFGEVMNSLPPAVTLQEAKPELPTEAPPIPPGSRAKEDVPLLEPPALDLPDEPAPAAAPAPPPEPITEGVVEFIELIPLEIEELNPDSSGPSNPKT